MNQPLSLSRLVARSAAAVAVAFVLAGCNGSSSSSTPATAPAKAEVRFVEGAPELEAIINGAPQDIGNAYLTVNNGTVASSFAYGTLTPFMPVTPGILSLAARNSLGAVVGPVNTTVPVAPGKSYTVIFVGAYPKYSALVFPEPAPNANASLALYEASPSHPSADFGRFKASSHANFQTLGSAHYGEVAIASIGKSVSNFGGYVGKGTQPVSNGAFTVSSIDTFDTANALPFNNATRLSLFLFDPKPGSGAGPAFGILDQ
jgi:hypothetical protein